MQNPTFVDSMRSLFATRFYLSAEGLGANDLGRVFIQN